MFYYPQSLILAEFIQHQNDQGLNSSESDYYEEEQNSSIIFELSQSYIQNQNQDNNQNDQNNPPANNQNNQNLNQQAGNGNQQNINLQGNDGINIQQNGDIQADVQGNNQQAEQPDMATSNHLGLFYLVMNRWLANLADPVLMLLFFVAGFINSSSITGDWSDTLKYTNFVIGACCTISNLINVLRLIKGKREQILLPLPQNPPQEEIQNASSQEKLQQVLNNIYFLSMIGIWLSQISLMILNKKFEDNIYQRYLILVFAYERIVMYLIQYFRKHPKTVKKLLLYCVATWPVYRKEFDEYIHYNFDFAIQIQTTFAKDPVQNYLKFMIYIYEFILVLQIIAFGCSQPKSQTIFQEFSYFFGAFYYLSIIYIAGLNYYVVTQNIRLSTKLNRVKNSVFLIVFFSSYAIFIALQMISALIQDRNKEYYILQFEPIFSFYFVCISMRIILNRITLRSLQSEILKHQRFQQEQNNLYPPQPQNNNILDSELFSQNELQQNNIPNQVDNINLFSSPSQQRQRNISNNSNNIVIQIDQISNISVISNHQGINNNNNNSRQQNQRNNQNNNNNRQGQQEDQLPHFQEVKRKIREMMTSQDQCIEKNYNLIVNYEFYTVTISLALLLFVYMFSDNLEIYEQNSIVCNLYYFLSIFSFMFYFLATKKISLAYEKLKNPSEPLSIYWIIPAQSYLNKLGWKLSWVLSFILIYLYFNITFANNSFVKAEYLFMIFFSLFTFFAFQIFHFFRRLLHPSYYQHPM